MLNRCPSAPRPILVLFVGFLLALHVWLALSATIDLGVTNDETAHLTGGYSYWKWNDYRLQPENGNLPQRWAALPLLALEPRLEPSDNPDAWSRSHVWLVAEHFFFGSGNNTDYMLLCARGAMVWWSAATGLLVFCWARRIWGDWGAILSLVLYTFSPTTLAHGALVTSDMCATFWMLASVGAWWRLTEKISPLRLCLSLAAVGFASVAKFSFVLLLPTFGLLACWRIFAPGPLAIAISGKMPVSFISRRTGKSAALSLLAIAHLTAVWGMAWAFFGFRYTAFAPELPEALKFFVSWTDVQPAAGFWHWFFHAARLHHLLPEAYLQGFAYVLQAAQSRGAFAAGHFSVTGWWWFFPYAFLVKSSIAELLAAAIALALGFAHTFHSRGTHILAGIERLAPLLIFAMLYAIFSLTSNLNIGHRHILPLYPVLFILSGALGARALRSSGLVGALLLGVLAITESSAIRPHYLTFFNQIAGGPSAGWRHLADSSLDWGQNLPRLTAWLRQNREANEKIYVSIFGSDNPFYHGIEATELAPIYSFGRNREWVELQSGIYCISATMLQDVYSPVNGPWTVDREIGYRKLLPMMRRELAAGLRSASLGEFGVGAEGPLWSLDRLRFARLCFYLRMRTPDAIIGNTIFIFRLSSVEVSVVVDGNFAEVVDATAKAAARAHGN